MKKALILALVLMGAAASVHAAPRYRAAVGGIFGIDVMGSLPSSFMVSFRLPKFPPVFAIGGGIPTSGEGASLALMADWWIWQGPLFSFINYYIGPGLYTSISETNFGMGIRMPIGLNAYPLDPLEIFLEFAPTIPLLSPDGLYFGRFALQAGFGFRFWF